MLEVKNVDKFYDFKEHINKKTEKITAKAAIYSSFSICFSLPIILFSTVFLLFLESS